MQERWQAGVERDKEPPPTVCNKWIELFKEMKELSKITCTFQRGLCCVNVTEPSMYVYSRMRPEMLLELAPTFAREQPMTSIRLG